MTEPLLQRETFWSHLENKVFIIIVLSTVATTMIVFSIVYSTTHLLLVEDIRQRTKIVNTYASEVIDLNTFSKLNKPSDSALNLYQRQQEALNGIRRIANVRYLFTAKRDTDNQLIYLVDGLKPTAEDFRNIGDRIEPEITARLDVCLNGTIVESDDILNTDWGAIFFTCWPFKNEVGKTVGAVVMEFDAQNIYSKHGMLTLYSIFVCIALATVFSFLARSMSKKISEPFYKKLAYTDPLTGLNNRTAFELDLEQCDKKGRVTRQIVSEVAGENLLSDETEKILFERDTISLIIYDLNNLKMINDQCGHAVGDAYIRKMAKIITSSALGGMGTTYRIGGDEFVTVISGSYKALEPLLENLFTQSRTTDNLDDYFEFSYGISTFEQKYDKTLHDTLVRADKRMYAFKKKTKEIPCVLCPAGA